jgi:DNA polymerase-3 subunit alpha/error-prone DNA polymerase
LALVDRDNLYGLWTFLAACRDEGLRPVVGAEISGPDGNETAVALAANAGGYSNLCRLITRRHRNPEFDLAKDLPEFGEGLRVLAASPRLLAHWAGSGLHLAAALARPRPRRHPLRETAEKFGLPAVAVHDAWFLHPADRETHRLLRAVAGRGAVSRVPPAEMAPPDAILAGPEALAQRFAALPEVLSAAEEFFRPIVFEGPDFGLLLPVWAGDDPEGILRRDAEAGARRRYDSPLPAAVRERLDYELGIIAQMGYAGYFLTVRDIVQRSPRTCGRGSGAASLVAYCLGVTNVCPIRHNLYFERFLHPGRTDPPDIDVDFAWDERDDVLNDVLARYGDRAALVCSVIRFGPRMAVRETARAWGLPDGEISPVADRLSHWWPSEHGLERELRQRPEARGLRLDPPWPKILAAADRLRGVPRHLSVHPGGVVLTPGPVHDFVPVETAAKGVPIIQWDKDAAEDAGLVKIDLLGNRSLAVVRDGLAAARKSGAEIDELRWRPEEDPAARKLVAEGRTMGCFYIESPAMRLLQRKSGRGDFDHLVLHSSIIRPAANAEIQEYLRRLHTGQWKPLHPDVENALSETYGLMVYQEDVSRAAIAIAGFSHAEADRLRRVISKKDRNRRLPEFRDRFFAGARTNAVPDPVAARVWEMMMSFDGYSFCKPHSASYARVSFQSAWLKAHYPAEFMAAVIENGGGFYSVFAYVSEARRMGLRILGPDVHQSEMGWTGRDRIVRAGLKSIKGLGRKTRERILREREIFEFSGAGDFFRRVRPEQDEGRALVQSGALDGLSPDESRGRLMWTLAKNLSANSPEKAGPGLFPAESHAPPPLPPDDPLRRHRDVFSVLGFLPDRHPMTFHRDRLRNEGALEIRSIPKNAGKEISFGGWLITGKPVRNGGGDPMAFLTFEDETDIVETVVFPEAWKRYSRFLRGPGPYRMIGRVESEWNTVTVTIHRVERL